MSERIYKLLNGSELICSEEGILSHRLEPDFIAITTDPNAEYMDLLALIDSLQQQVAGLNEESLANFQTAAERGKRLAERDRTIDLLTKQITDEVGISAKAIAERDMFKTSFEHWNKEAHRVVNENSKLRKALEEIADSKKDMSGVLCRVAARQALGRE
ncbi:hypothetical protein MF628_000929 [Paenibacillus polymyxa]|uniref:hypothetical protein n=1 Tax=Paenibacillus polymyxa TaxID=1406 RepID=UPI0020257EA7|nr:hypothetical protein [Paenibacillus polymyxa]URJ46399.1 hypothetical protein MF628_000929 [Paenibacillus polymyxa]